MSDRRRPPHLWVLLVLLVAEFALVTGLAVTLVIEMLVAEADSLASAIALTVLAAIAAAFMGAIILGALRGHAWIRAAATVWQVLQFAVGLGSITGTFSSPAIGWPLIVVAVIAFVLLQSRPVADAVVTRPDRGA